MEKKRKNSASKAGQRTITPDELFVRCVSAAMSKYSKDRREYEDEIAKRGYRLRRGGYERVTWNSTYIAEQYKLCLKKECKEPATVRHIICVIGDDAVLIMNRYLAKLESESAEKEGKETHQE